MEDSGVMMTTFAKKAAAFANGFLLVAALFAAAQARAQSIDDLHKKAAAEGTVNFYGTLAQINAEKILPVFEKRFPGIAVKQLDVTSDQLVTRATTEARAGKTIGDIFQAPAQNRAADARSEAAFGCGFAGSKGLFGRYEGRRLDSFQSAIHRGRLEHQPGETSGGAETVR
jgi:ABC-type glycerol-3-phosphate transport system substrate-binding protein